MKAVVAAFNQEKALVGAFSVITNLRMELFEALVSIQHCVLFATLLSSQVQLARHISMAEAPTIQSGEGPSMLTTDTRWFLGRYLDISTYIGLDIYAICWLVPGGCWQHYSH